MRITKPRKRMICVGSAILFLAASVLIDWLAEVWLVYVLQFLALLAAATWVFLLWDRIGLLFKADKRYYPATLHDVLQAQESAYLAMEHIGYIRKNYKPDERDCDDFQLACHFFMSEWFRENCKLDGQGIPLARFDYINRNGTYHVVTEALLNDNTSVYIDCYPGGPVGTMSLTKKEIESATWRNFVK